MATSTNIAYGFIGAAALVSILASFSVYTLIQGRQNQAVEVEEEVRLETVVVASRPLYQGVQITTDDLYIAEVPLEYLPRVLDKESGEEIEAIVFSSRDRVVGQLPRERILKNEFIRPERLADGNAGVGLNAVIPRGMRAISLDMKGADAVTGFLEPGNYVDVLVTMEDELGGLRTETIMQTVFVLGVNSKAEHEGDEERGRRGKQRPSVTFLVTPEQAEEIAYAHELGEVSLALRNVQDVVYTPVAGASIGKLLRRLKPEASPKAAPRVRRVSAPAEPTSSGPKIDIIRGNVRVSVEADSLNRPVIPGSNDEGNR